MVQHVACIVRVDCPHSDLILLLSLLSFSCPWTIFMHAAQLSFINCSHLFTPNTKWVLQMGTMLLELLSRLAPLSQGRIEPTHSTLMCSYHGWAFNGQGRAVSIPQARFQNPVAEEAACKSNRSCVKAFPTTVCGCLCRTALIQLNRNSCYIVFICHAPGATNTFSHSHCCMLCQMLTESRLEKAVHLLLC